MGHGHGNGQLHPHAPGVILEGFFLGQLEAVQIGLVDGIIPPAVGFGHDLSHLGGAENLGKIGLIQHHADVLLDGQKFRGGGVYSQHRGGAAVRPQGIHQKTDGGGFARAVFAHQTADRPLRDFQGQVLNGKGTEGLADVIECNGIHVVSSSDKRSSICLRS